VGKVKQQLDGFELPGREAHNSRMFVDLCENIHIHYREFRIVFSLDEYFEFVDILTRSTEDVRSYLAQNPDYREGVYPTTLIVAGGPAQQLKLLQNSPQPNQPVYFSRHFAIELQDQSVVDEIHVHWRDYRLALPREHFKLIADSFARAKAQLLEFEAHNDYQRTAHRDRAMADFATEARTYATHRAHIMGEQMVALADIRNRYDADSGQAATAPTWKPDPAAIAHLVACYASGQAMPPIILSTETNGQQQVIDGNHRLHAARQLGLQQVNCIVMDISFSESEYFRKAEACLKQFDAQTGYRYNTSGFNRQYFAHRASRYYADHFHRRRLREIILRNSKLARWMAGLARRGKAALGPWLHRLRRS
jgi:hypothetical protein